MKNKKGYVVLQLSMFLGLLAFIGLMIFEVEKDKKKFIDASINQSEFTKETEIKIGMALTSFTEEVIKKNITENELIENYYAEGYKNFDVIISYDKRKNMFSASGIRDNQKLCVVYYDYEVKKFKDDGIINTIQFYKV
ncbi:MAG: hypothetical protein ACRCTZ_09880 [Sarcina sp.]